LAKKKKRGEQASFLFDDDAGKAADTIDLFGSDDEAPEEHPEPLTDETDDEPLPSGTDEPVEPEPAPAKEGSARGAAKDASAPDASEKPKADKSSGTPTFRFDRYGRRVDRKKIRYGKRKNAPKATTTVVEHDTEAKREYDEARARSRARAEKRAREEARQAELKKAERKKKRQRSASTLIMGFLALLVLAALTWFVTRLSSVRVMNVPNGYTEDEIVELTGLKPKLKKRSALFINTADVEKHIRDNDAYLDATVRFSFPSTIHVTVSKREEAACVRWGPQSEYLAIIDENGTVLNAAAERTNGLLIADGMSISSAVNGTRIGDSSDIQVAALIRLLTKLKELGLLERTPKINRINMTELMQIRMYLEGTPYTIEVGDTSNLETKLMLLQKHWAEIIQEAGDFVRSGTTNTATIYLYSKGGITVSPYEPGYTIPTLPPASVSPSFAPGEQPSANPNEQPNEPTPEPNTPAPQVTPMPHQDDPFTG
jgi:cell division septal protein FtsQ